MKYFREWIHGGKDGKDGKEGKLVVHPFDELIILIKLAGPVTCTTLCFFAISLTETIVVGHLGTSYLAAVAYSQIAMDFTLILFTQGFNQGARSLCSQAFGAKNYKLLGQYAQITCFCLSIVSIFLGLTWWNIGYFLRIFVDASDDVVIYSQVYSRISIFWLWPRLVFQVLSMYYTSQQIVVPTAIISFVFVLINIILNIFLVHGMFGVQGMGLVGCPIATSISQALRLLVYILYMNVYCGYHKSSWFWNLDCFKSNQFRMVLKTGLPLMMGQLFENAQLQTVALFSASIGQVQLASHDSMLQLYFFFTSPIYGLSNASITRMGMYLGAGKPIHAKAVSHLMLLCTIIFSIIVLVLFLSLRFQLGKVFSNDPNVWENIASICILAGSGYWLMSLFYYSMAVLNSQARTLPIMLAFLVGAWCVGVPLAYILGLYEHYGLIGIWIGMAIGYFFTMFIGIVNVLITDWSAEAKAAVTRSKCSKGSDTKGVDETTSLI